MSENQPRAMTNADLDENDPIYKAIDKGGGQTCDIAGVLRELGAAGFVIVPRRLALDVKVRLRCSPDLCDQDASRDMERCIDMAGIPNNPA